MSVQALSCPKCGGAITVPPDLEFFNCAYCGTGIKVDRGQGFVALKLAEAVTRAIQESGATTQAEIKRLELSQRLSSAQVQLTNVQSEIRTIERTKQSGQTRKHLKQLRTTEGLLIQQINQLHATLYPDQAARPAPAASSSASGRWKTGCALGCATYMAFAVIFAAASAAISREAIASDSPLTSVVGVIAFIAGCLVFIIYMNPNSAQSIRRMFTRSAAPQASAETAAVETVSEIANPFDR